MVRATVSPDAVRMENASETGRALETMVWKTLVLALSADQIQ